MNDIQNGRRARALRHRARFTQEELSEKTGVSQGSISLFERGRLGGMTVGHMRRMLAGLDAELVLIVTWRGGDLDRLLDARHARLGEGMARILGACGWEVAPEVSYSRYGERGSIDLVAWHTATRSLLIVELKSEIASVEETLRKHDAKARLGPTIVRERFGWEATNVARLLVMPEHRTIRRQIEDKPGPVRTGVPEASCSHPALVAGSVWADGGTHVPARNGLGS